MENLTRNNYEIWFLDYLDGQLSDEQLETLLDFLEQNPGLKQELLGVSGVSLAAGSVSLDQKEQLLKTPADIPGIAAIDQLCIARMENDLTDEQAADFDSRLDEDMELSGNYAAFRHTRLNPADAVIYPYKKELRKKTVFFSPWLITAISSAAVILLAWFLWPDSHKTVTPPLAKTEQPATEQPATRNLQPATRSLQPATDNRQLTTGNRLIAANRKPITHNSKPTTVIRGNSKPIAVENPARESVPMNKLVRKSVLAGPRIPDPQSTKLLVASNYPPAMDLPVTADNALTLPQYALQLFRQRILGEDLKLVRRTRFSMWEVAGAGVNKINDLAGTQMKLNREYDSKGDILAVSFNSRLIDVESPIKGQGNR